MTQRKHNNIATQRIRTLYQQARQTHKTNPKLAKRYTHLIKKIQQRTRTQLPQDIKTGICKKCDTILIQGVNAHTRIRQRREPHIATTCHNCGNITRTPLRRKQR